MRKKRLIILLSIMVVALVIGCFACMYFTAAWEKEYFYEYSIFNEDADTVNQRLNMFPEQIELGSGANPGYLVHFQDCSLSLSGYNNVVIRKEDLIDVTTYFVDENKFVSLRSYPIDSVINDPIELSQIEKAAGKKINNSYEFWEASFYCTPENFSLLDADKNIGVSRLLDRKKLEMLGSCYQYNNGVIRGFIRVFTAPGGTLSTVYFSNCEDPDSYYVIFFGNFSLDEIKDILGTITFDGSGANQ